MHPVDATAEPADARRYPAPLSARRALSIAGLLGVAPDGTVLDLGPGPAGLLLDAVALNACRGLGLVRCEAAAVAARAAAQREGLGERIAFQVGTAPQLAPPRRVDAVLGVGGFARPSRMLEDAAARCLGWLRVGGLFVYGEPFLRRAPAPVYREWLGARGHGLPTPGVSAGAVVAAGFELALTAVLSESEWDTHESAAYRATLRLAAQSDNDRDAAALRERAERRY